MKRAKPPKRKVNKVEGRQIVEMTNQLNFAAMVRVLKIDFEWSDRRIKRFVASYIALIDEIYDQRQTVPQFIDDVHEMTGIDIKKLLSEVIEL